MTPLLSSVYNHGKEKTRRLQRYTSSARGLGKIHGRTHLSIKRAEQTLKHQHFQAGWEARVVEAAAVESNQAGAASRSSATGEVSKVTYAYFHLLQVDNYH